MATLGRILAANLGSTNDGAILDTRSCILGVRICDLLGHSIVTLMVRSPVVDVRVPTLVTAF